MQHESDNTMDDNRKAYRKNLVSSGQLYAAGELLSFIGYNISVKGMSVEIVPGNFLSDIEDFEGLIKENASVEIFVKDLMLTGEAEIIWVKNEEGSVHLGLEFKNVIYNAEKLWHKRRYFRKSKKASGLLIADEQKFAFESINISVDGMMIHLTPPEEDTAVAKPTDAHFHVGFVVKIISQALNIKAVAKIAWIDSETNTTMGLRYLTVENA